MSATSSGELLVVVQVILNASGVEAAAASVGETLTAYLGRAVASVVQEISNASEAVVAALEQVNEHASACHRMELETSISR